MILFSLAKMGFNIEDSKYIPFSIFNEMMDIQLEISNAPTSQEPKMATQKDIDSFF